MNYNTQPKTPLVVNARFLTQKVTGTQRYAINISRELKRLQPETVFLAPPAIDDPQLAAELEVKIIGKRSYRIYHKLKLPANLLWEQINLPLYLARNDKPPCLLNLINLAPYFYKNNFITIHDLTFKLYPEYFSRAFAALYNFLVPRLARRARHIFTDSQHSKSDICKYLNIFPDKVTVVYCAVDMESISDNSQPPYPWPYILAVGALEPRKNIPRLIAAFNKLPDNNDLRLVIVGKSDLKVFSKTSVSEKVQCKHTDKKIPRIIFTGYLEDHKLAILYKHAICFCYPSLYEGFGLPPLEAQTQGCPVIVSDRASLPEVFGDSVLYCNPEDINEIKQNLQTVLNDNNLRQFLIDSGLKNVKRFRWAASALIITKAIVGELQ